MPIAESPHKCDFCGGELLAEMGKVGKWNALLHVGGPGQEPKPMGNLWAFYRCLKCGFEGPWKRQYIGSRELQTQYLELLKFCLEKHKSQQANKDIIEKLHGMLDAKKVMHGMPGASGFDEAIATAIQPILEKMKALSDQVIKFDNEVKKRKGGRPPLTEEERQQRQLERMSKKGRNK